MLMFATYVVWFAVPDLYIIALLRLRPHSGQAAIRPSELRVSSGSSCKTPALTSSKAGPPAASRLPPNFMPKDLLSLL